MIGRDEQLRGIGEGQILGEPPRVRMAVRRDDRQIAHIGIETARNGAGRGIGRKQAIFVQHGDLGSLQAARWKKVRRPIASRHEAFNSGTA